MFDGWMNDDTNINGRDYIYIKDDTVKVRLFTNCFGKSRRTTNIQMFFSKMTFKNEIVLASQPY